jgi:hypothetical protein
MYWSKLLFPWITCSLLLLLPPFLKSHLSVDSVTLLGTVVFLLIPLIFIAQFWVGMFSALPKASAPEWVVVLSGIVGIVSWWLVIS